MSSSKSAKVKLAYIVTQMPAPSEVFLAVEIRGLVEQGNAVQVLALRSPHPDHAKLVIDQQLEKFKITYFPLISFSTLVDIFHWSRSKPFILFRLLFTLISTCWRMPILLLKSLTLVPKSFSVAREIETGHYEAVHVAWGHYPAITAYLIRQLMPNIALTLALGAYDRDTRHPMTAIVANMVDRVLTQSQTNADLITHEWPRPKTRLEVIYRGIEITNIHAHTTASRRHGLIVTAARLLPHKGHQYLIRALPKILAVEPSAKLLIFGTGPYHDELVALIARLGLQEQVELAGHQSHEKLFMSLASASVFALASDRDWLPNSVKEAMAMGIPVITTPTVGMDELVQNGKTGLIVPFGDVDVIADCLIAVLTDPVLPERLRDAARLHIQHFDILRTSQQRHNLYQQLIAEKQSS